MLANAQWVRFHITGFFFSPWLSETLGKTELKAVLLNWCQIVGGWLFGFVKWGAACKLLCFENCRKMVWHIWSYPRASLGSVVSEERQFSFFISRYFVLFFSNFRVTWWHASPTALLQRLARVIDLSRLPDFVYAGRPSKLLFTLNHVVVVHNHPWASQQYTSF